MKITKSGNKKVRLLKEKMLKEKLTKKVYNYLVWHGISMEEMFKYKSVKTKRKLNNIDRVMDVVKLDKFKFSTKKEVQEFRQQSKNLDRENRKLEHKVEILKDPNVCECIIGLCSLSIRREKINQAILVVLIKLAKKDIEMFGSGGVKASLINARSPSYLK